MKVCRGIVISNKGITEKYYNLKVHCPEIAKEVKEGQIIHIECSASFDPFLRRPFSIYRFNRELGMIEFMYIVKGKGTRIMSSWGEGEEISLLGPVGRPYEISKDVKAVSVIGRGVGIASIVSLAEKARKEGVEVLAVLSGRNREAIIGKDLLEGIGCRLYTLNDRDGTSSLENLEKILLKGIEELSIKEIFTCGSNRIAQLAKKLSRQMDLRAYVSLEEHMACGIGACLGCVCETVKGYKTVCKDGPVFDVEEVKL